MKKKKVVEMQNELLPYLGLKVGNKVEWQGVTGKVVLIITGAKYSIVVDFGDKVPCRDSLKCFINNGLYLDWHKTPSLKKIEKLKKAKK